jgi:glutathione S-transferase
MLKVWGRRSSFNVQKVLWLIGELGLPYEHVAVGGEFGGLTEPGFLALNPHGRIPVLEDGDVPIWESHAILRYIAARYGRSAFWNEDPSLRAPIDAWMDWAQTALLPAFLGGVFWGYFRTPDTQRDWPAIRASIAQCGRLFGLLDQVLAGSDFLAGAALTLADIPAGASLYRYFALDIERPALANVEAWRRRLEDRGADREHVMIPFDEMRGRLAY